MATEWQRSCAGEAPAAVARVVFEPLPTVKENDLAGSTRLVLRLAKREQCSELFGGGGVLMSTIRKSSESRFVAVEEPGRARR